MESECIRLFLALRWNGLLTLQLSWRHLLSKNSTGPHTPVVLFLGSECLSVQRVCGVSNSTDAHTGCLDVSAWVVGP